jgi:hypothetical protein
LIPTPNVADDSAGSFLHHFTSPILMLGKLSRSLLLEPFEVQYATLKMIADPRKKAWSDIKDMPFMQ